MYFDERGSREVADMKRSVRLLGKNPCCQTLLLKGANHGFPMRKAAVLNPIPETFFARHCGD